jgi:Ca2+-binding EF-hand superfamily protein
VAVGLILIAAVAAAQAQAQSASVAPPPEWHTGRFTGEGAGRPFMSPMGEPFVGQTAGEDGLLVWFRQADRNHDGVITADEMAADAERFFQTLDTNHDGEIDPDEIAHYENVSGASSGGLGGDDEAAAGRYGLLEIPEPVTSADADFNRAVSTNEFRNAAIARFQLLDIDHTGRLTLPELQGIRKAAASAARRPPKPPATEIDQDSSGDQPPM